MKQCPCLSTVRILVLAFLVSLFVLLSSAFRVIIAVRATNLRQSAQVCLALLRSDRDWIGGTGGVKTYLPNGQWFSPSGKVFVISFSCITWLPGVRRTRPDSSRSQTSERACPVLDSCCSGEIPGGSWRMFFYTSKYIFFKIGASQLRRVVCDMAAFLCAAASRSSARIPL